MIKDTSAVGYFLGSPCTRHVRSEAIDARTVTSERSIHRSTDKWC